MNKRLCCDLKAVVFWFNVMLAIKTDHVTSRPLECSESQKQTDSPLQTRPLRAHIHPVRSQHPNWDHASVTNMIYLAN